LPSWLAQLSEQNGPDFSIAVIGSGYWPLPWYLRQFEKVGYWPEIQEHHDEPVILVMPALFDEADKIFSLSHTSVPRGLRNNHPMMVFIRNDVWDTWMKESEQ
jgi:predicted membrane-bound mannosyltransferase